jgi:hypothetical protein
MGAAHSGLDLQASPAAAVTNIRRPPTNLNRVTES